MITLSSSFLIVCCLTSFISTMLLGALRIIFLIIILFPIIFIVIILLFTLLVSPAGFTSLLFGSPIMLCLLCFTRMWMIYFWILTCDNCMLYSVVFFNSNIGFLKMFLLICLSFLKATILSFRFFLLVLNLSCWLVLLRRDFLFWFSLIKFCISNMPMWRLHGNYYFFLNNCFYNFSCVCECRSSTFTSCCGWFEFLFKYLLWFRILSSLYLLLSFSLWSSLLVKWSVSFMIILLGSLIFELFLISWSTTEVSFLFIFTFVMLWSLSLPLILVSFILLF